MPLHATLRAAEECGCGVRDVESLREHYALTLGHWVRRLAARWNEAVLAAGEPTCRAWRLYMAGAAHRFRTGELTVYQTLLAAPDAARDRRPRTRAGWYR